MLFSFSICSLSILFHRLLFFQHFVDSTDRPYPPLRFRADDEIIKPIREKEKGDWKKLTMEEKKLLYRYSFRRTQAELVGWNVYRKMYWSYILIWSSIGLGLVGFLKHFSMFSNNIYVVFFILKIYLLQVF